MKSEILIDRVVGLVIILAVLVAAPLCGYGVASNPPSSVWFWACLAIGLLPWFLCSLFAAFVAGWLAGLVWKALGMYAAAFKDGLEAAAGEES